MKILEITSEFIKKINQLGIRVSDEKEIPYGISLTLIKAEHTCKINIYHTDKKGTKYVIQGKDSLLKRQLQTVISGPISDEKIHDWKKWSGSDEAGKGDYFGPLVVCAFYCDDYVKKQLVNLNVRDSKTVKSFDALEKMNNVISTKLRGSFEVMILVPEKYNELYERFTQQGKKLNELLAWMHARAIVNLAGRRKFDGAFLDKFSNMSTISSGLKELKNIPLRAATKGERDIAVAAASIVARYNYLKVLKHLSRKYDIELKSGAGADIIKLGKSFVSKHSAKELGKIGKLHFKTTNEILKG